ncbi:MAG TPA: histidine phosphatase family protein [Thermoanaerobaculia bacterium]|nr:histidine phosphatase family protein [Thermoanaerobaculia bacterium]
MSSIGLTRTLLGFCFLISMTGLISMLGGASEAVEGDLIDGLRRGGYVIYFRHAATNPDQVDMDTAKLDRCETQRNLSPDGRRMARDLGGAFQTLRIPVGKVVTSPYCRAVDTAELAFGRHETSSALYFAMGAAKDQRESQGAELRQMLSTPPRRGTNTVIVSHHANLKEATGLWPKREGDAHVFRPRPDGGFEHVGEVAVEEWSRRAGKAAQAPRPDGGS